jgi:hypothetical protein
MEGESRNTVCNEKIFNQRWDDMIIIITSCLLREAQHPVVQLGTQLLDELEYAAP